MNPGEPIGRYKIRRKIGAGGMGEVYLAHDTELNRPVALKILPKEFSTDEVRRYRFRQEARAASALNHPNIITIFEVGESDEGCFIATEYVEGETLRLYLKDSSLKILEAVKIAEQIARALVAAHSAGIVHRDIKPENIMVRKDGYIKVLDFGLAKPTDQPAEDDETKQFGHTLPGMVMGSVRYMSPEQARGLQVDARTDIWSLGVVLFEMLTGQTLFRGATTSDTLAAVIHVEPTPLARLAPNSPTELQRIVRKALQKDRNERYQSIKDFALDLKNLIYELEHEISLDNQRQITSNPNITENPTMIHHTSGASFNTARANHPTQVSAHPVSSAEYIAIEVNRNKWKIVTGVVCLFVVCATGILGYRLWIKGKQLQVTTAFEKNQVSRIEANGNVRLPVISPDGKYVAYVSFDNVNQTLMVRQISTGSQVTVVPPTPLYFAAMTFSHAGDRIYYTQTSTDTVLNTLYQIPTLGGTPKQVVDDVDSAVTFSPDGKQLVFMRNVSKEDSSVIFIANADGSNLQQLISTKQTEFRSFASPAWSPDGTKILVSVGNGRDNNAVIDRKIAEVSVADGSFRLVSPKNWSRLSQLHWLKDGSGFLALAKDTEEATTQIWRFSYPEAEGKQITNDVNDYRNLSVAADGETLITVRSDVIQSLWSFTPAKNEFTQLIPEKRNLFWDSRLSITSGGGLIFSRREGQEVGIWASDAEGKNERPLILNAALTSPPEVTSDGRFIVFGSKRSGDSRIWRADADGKNVRQLTENTAGQQDFNPKIIPDGANIVFSRQIDGSKSALMRVSLEGGNSELIFDEENVSSFNPIPSPDGKRLAFYSFDPVALKRTITVAVLEENKVKQVEKRLPSDFVSNFSWSPDGKSLTYQRQDNVSGIWKMPIDGGKPELLTDLKSGRIFGAVWSGDARKLFLVRGITHSDLVLIRDIEPGF